MRLKRISLFALMSLVVASGCSANRYAATSLRGERERVTEPPRHDHEYSPSLTPDDDEFLEPPTGEPAPAPPALGVSRVKSVSWLREFGSRKREVQAPDLSCSDEELIGKCSPVDPCVPNSECGTQPFGTLSSDNSKHASPFRRMKKSMSRLLGRKSTPRTPPECREFSASGSCTTADIPEHNSTRKCQVSPEVRQRRSPETVNSNRSPKAPCHVGALRQDCRKECLAEPLIESGFDPAEPGLITPADRIPAHPEQSVPPNPELPLPNTVAPSAEPTEPTFPVPEAPQIKTLDPTSTGFIEPQLWPKLEERAEIRSISKSVPRVINPTAAVKPQVSAQVPSQSPSAPGEPILVIPRPRQ